MSETKIGLEQAFAEGSGGLVKVYNKHHPNESGPYIFRGLKNRKAIKTCIKHNRDFYYIDTGYFGNGKHKIYHRAVKNNLQYLGPMQDRPDVRLRKTGVLAKKMSSGSDILLVLPSVKVMTFFDLDLDSWIASTIAELKKHTDRKIITRLKPPRQKRVRGDESLEAALHKDVHCVVTYNSIAAVESLIFGKPVITLGPNAAQDLSSHNISDIENPKRPGLDEVNAFLRHLAFHQFTWEEIKDGSAWRILNGPRR